MGNFSITSETIFDYPASTIYAFVTNPGNWGKTYKGSGGVTKEQLQSLPLKIGDTWTEKVDLPPNIYVSTWTLITCIPNRKWVFQQVNNVGATEDGSSKGVDGITTISYTFEENAGQGMTLFTRNLTCELPHGVGIPDDLLTVCCRPDGIDRYHAAIEKELDAENGRERKIA